MREAEFTPGEVASLLASRRAENARRGPHGYTIAEATDPANQGKFRVDLPLKDFAMDKLTREQERYFNQYPSAKGDTSLIWNVRLDD